jgi:hypothetical protein
MTWMLIAQMMISPYVYGGGVVIGGAGSFTYEDGTSIMLYQDSTSKMKKEFSSVPSNFLYEDNASKMLYQDSTSKMQTQ